MWIPVFPRVSELFIPIFPLTQIWESTADNTNHSQRDSQILFLGYNALLPPNINSLGVGLSRKLGWFCSQDSNEEGKNSLGQAKLHPQWSFRSVDGTLSLRLQVLKEAPPRLKNPHWRIKSMKETVWESANFASRFPMAYSSPASDKELEVPMDRSHDESPPWQRVFHMKLQRCPLRLRMWLSGRVLEQNKQLSRKSPARSESTKWVHGVLAPCAIR